MRLTIGVDGSKYGQWALDWALALPFARAPLVKAVHMVDTASLRAPFMPQPTIPGQEVFFRAEAKRLEEQGKHVAQRTRKLLAPLKNRAKVVLKRGSVAWTIIKEAKSGKDLIILGQRGLTALDRFFLGSVSSQVATHAFCSVLIVKGQSRPLSRMLLAVDGSKASERALQFLLKEMAPRRNEPSEVVVLQVFPPYAYTKVTMAGMASTHRFVTKLESAGYIAKESLQAGNPAEEIIKAVNDYRADLLVVGAKGHSSVGRFVMGSVSSRLVRHSPCSILVVR